jgi:hypothetical protein
MKPDAILCIAAAGAACAMLGAGPACAQSTGDSATVDALAMLVRADEPLALTSGAPLHFGQVTIPRGGNVSCIYAVRGDGTRAVSQNNVSYGEGATPAGCSYRDDRSDRASLTLRCEAERQVAFTLQSQSSGLQGSAVFFESVADDVAVDEQSRSSWDHRCTGTDMILRIGGQLQIHSEAQPTGAEGVQVGSITIEAFYP